LVKEIQGIGEDFGNFVELFKFKRDIGRVFDISVILRECF
jgi:hypothetical protein